MNKEEKAYIEEGLKNGSVIRESDLSYADVDSINVREKAVVPELEIEKYAQDPSTMELEMCCGNCAWFYGEDTDGCGFCACQKEKEIDWMFCSDICELEDDYVSRKEMRHHMAVFLQWERYNKTPRHQLICRVPSNSDMDNAMKFAYKYIKVFSEL